MLSDEDVQRILNSWIASGFVSVKNGALRVLDRTVLMLSAPYFIYLYHELLSKDPEALKNVGKMVANYLVEKGYELGKGKLPVEQAAITVLSGFGQATSSIGENGGTVVVTNAAIPMAYREIYGLSSSPICKFQEGLLEGSIAIRTNRKVKVTEVSCVSMGASSCVFEVKYES